LAEPPTQNSASRTGKSAPRSSNRFGRMSAATTGTGRSVTCPPPFGTWSRKPVLHPASDSFLDAASRPIAQTLFR